MDDSMRRAEQLRKEGKTEEAVEIWRGMIVLYADDPGAAEVVGRARAALAAANAAPGDDSHGIDAAEPLESRPANSLRLDEPE
jgi:hypothetical protein